MARRGVQGDRGENGTLSEKLERGVAPIDMGDIDLGHGDMGQPGRPDSKDLGGTGRSIHHHHLEADMVHVCAGIHFLLRYLLPVAKVAQAQVPSIQRRLACLPDFNQITAHLAARIFRLENVEHI